MTLASCARSASDFVSATQVLHSYGPLSTESDQSEGYGEPSTVRHPIGLCPRNTLPARVPGSYEYPEDCEPDCGVNTDLPRVHLGNIVRESSRLSRLRSTLLITRTHCSKEHYLAQDMHQEQIDTNNSTDYPQRGHDVTYETRLCAWCQFYLIIMHFLWFTASCEVQSHCATPDTSREHASHHIRGYKNTRVYPE